MKQPPVTIIISDLHLGGGKKADPGDDHVCDRQQLVRFIGDIAKRKDGPVELFINGDFLDFAQVEPDVYQLGSPDYWCSEAESVKKLEAIIKGHADVFKALKKFQKDGNVVTVAAGNHDVDLYWKKVRERLRQVAGPLNFELGKDVYSRYQKRLVIGHGHAYDPANTFGKAWADPIRKAPDGPRLVMCPGTLFMVRFVNWLDEKYHFADNIKPLLALARLLWTEQRQDFKTAAGLLLQFADEYPRQFLSRAPAAPDADVAGSISRELKESEPRLLAQMTELYRKTRAADASPAAVRKSLDSKEKVLKFFGEVVARLPPPAWLPLFERRGRGTLSIAHSVMPWRKEKDILREEAIGTYLTLPHYEVVVFGHTHQPDEWRGSTGKWDGGYFNPGSWTRYLDLDKVEGKGKVRLSLEDLEKEEDYPYQLNYIRVRETAGGTLRADKICYEEASGKRFAPTPRPKLMHRPGADN